MNEKLRFEKEGRRRERKEEGRMRNQEKRESELSIEDPILEVALLSIFSSTALTL